MRNLKKVLSLALALVMLVGMMTIGAGAATYTDSDQVTKAEAVDVMSGIGVLTGTDTGAFNPKGNLNREQAAKILAIATLGPTVANILSASGAPFADVPANSWSAGYIAYCSSSAGGWIITGRDDGLFHPWDLVTGTEFAKMLLVAIGNDPYRYVGDVWAINVQTDALKTTPKLTDNVGITNWNAALTREQAAQMAFNAIRIGEDVTTTSTKYVVTSTSTALGGTPYKTAAAGETNQWAATDTFATRSGINGDYFNTYDLALDAGKKAILGYATQGDAESAVTGTYGVHFTITPMTITSTVTKGSLADTVFGLSVSTNRTTDAYGNPVKTWLQNNTTTVATVKTTPAYETTSALTGGMLYTALGLTSAPTVTYVVDGKTETAISVASASTDVVAGAGAKTSVYFTGENAIKITVANTYVGAINSWHKAAVNADGQVTAKEYVTVDPDSTAKPGTLKDSGKFETAKFTKDDADDGTVVIYTATWNGTDYTVKSVDVPQSIEVTPTRINANGTFVADGNTYGYSYKAVAANVLTGTELGKKTVLYFDTCGNVINTDAVVAPNVTNYAVILGLGGTSGTGSGTLGTAANQTVMLLLPDGTNTTVKYVVDYESDPWELVDPADTTKDYYAIKNAATGYVEDLAAAGTWTSGNDETSTNHGAHDGRHPAVYDVVTYQPQSNGSYKISLVSNTNGTSSAIKTNVPTIASGVVANDKTVFLIRTDTDNANTTSYTAYVGIANVPSLSTVTAANSRIVSANGIAKLVFVHGYTGATTANTSSDLVFIAAPATGAKAVVTLDADGNQVFTFDQKAVMNGSIIDVKVNGTSVSASSIADDTLAGSVTRNDAGVITATSNSNIAYNSTTGTGMLDVNEVETAAKDGIITLQKDTSGSKSNKATYAYNASTVVYKVDDGEITVSTIDKIDVGKTVTAYVVNNVITAIFYNP